MNIIVLCGGLSNERDVSLVSGNQIANALRNLGHRTVLIDVFFGYTGSYRTPADIFTMPYNDSIAKISETAPDIEAIKKSRKQNNTSRIGDNVIEVCRAADMVFMALHGEDGEDGKIQAMFELMDIKYTGSDYVGSALAMNKGYSKQLFRQNGILTPNWIVVKKSNLPYPNIGFPCVVKPCSGGSSVGASVVYNEADYLKALRLAFQYEETAIVEQYIQGRECDVGVLAGKALPVIEICPKCGFYDYKHKYQKGLAEEFCPADLPDATTKKLQDIGVKVFELLNLHAFARMDFILTENGEAYCLEANALPGMTPTSLIPQEAAAIGLTYEDVCQTILNESLKKYKRFEDAL